MSPENTFHRCCFGGYDSDGDSGSDEPDDDEGQDSAPGSGLAILGALPTTGA